MPSQKCKPILFEGDGMIEEAGEVAKKYVDANSAEIVT